MPFFIFMFVVSLLIGDRHVPDIWEECGYDRVCRYCGGTCSMPFSPPSYSFYRTGVETEL